MNLECKTSRAAYTKKPVTRPLEICLDYCIYCIYYVYVYIILTAHGQAHKSTLAIQYQIQCFSLRVTLQQQQPEAHIVAPVTGVKGTQQPAVTTLGAEVAA